MSAFQLIARVRRKITEKTTTPETAMPTFTAQTMNPSVKAHALLIPPGTMAHVVPIYDFTRNTRAPHFTPQHWLLCHMGLY